MKALRIVTLALLVSVAVTEAVPAHAQAPRPTREQRLAERTRRMTEKANALTELKLKEGKNPSYNRLLKSTDYKLMYREGLRYYNMTRRGKDYNSAANYRKAQTLFSAAERSLVLNGSQQADSLLYFLGCSYYRVQDFQSSQEVFDRFRRQFGMSPFVEDAEYKYAMGFYALAPDPKHDQSLTQMAIGTISEYMGRYPATEHRQACDDALTDLRRRLYTKSYENARLYYNIGQYRAAVRALTNAIAEYPLSPFREELMYLATRSAWMLARNSVPGLMTDRYMSMMDNYYNLISEFPETRHLREVEQMRDEARKHIDASAASSEGGASTADANDIRPAQTTTTTTTTTNGN
jgi:outer membrane protein assembly factor BamD